MAREGYTEKMTEETKGFDTGGVNAQKSEAEINENNQQQKRQTQNNNQKAKNKKAERIKELRARLKEIDDSGFMDGHLLNEVKAIRRELEALEARK